MLYDTVKEYLKNNIYPFHMPGHKHNASFLPQDLLSLDMTEIPGLDNLYNAEGVIRFDQEKTAAIYGADTCLFSVNGSTAGIIASICSACAEGESLLLARNSHISAFSGLVFSGARPVYLYPDVTAYGLYGGINPAYLKQMLGAHPECRAVFITNPTYEGFVSDIEKIAGYVHSLGKLLIVDEAHGAHFPFHGIFPEPAIRLGADIAITSPHKTLPALTQSALILVKDGRADIERLKFFAGACQTSSPSYIIMSVMDYIFDFLSQHTEIFNAYANRLISARGALSGLSAFRLIGNEIIGAVSIYAVDIGKLLFVMTGGLTGSDLAQKLADEHKVQLEMSAGRFALALTSPADTDEGLERLIAGIKAIDAAAYGGDKTPRYALEFNYRADIRITPRQAVFSEYERTEPYKGIGKVSADFACAYPPGIPAVAPGELITAEAARELSRMNIGYIKTVKDL